MYWTYPKNTQLVEYSKSIYLGEPFIQVRHVSFYDLTYELGDIPAIMAANNSRAAVPNKITIDTAAKYFCLLKDSMDNIMAVIKNVHIIIILFEPGRKSNDRNPEIGTTLKISI